MNSRSLTVTALLIAFVGFISCEETYNNPLDPQASQEDVQAEAPTGLTAQVKGDSLITLEWSAGLNYGFRVLKNNLTLAELDASEATSVGGNFSYTDESAIAVNTEITYEVATLLPNGSSAGASIVTIAQFEMPSNLQIEVVDDENFTLSWTDNTPFEEGFIVERAVSNGAFSEIARLPENTVSYTDTRPFSQDSVYRYSVKVFTSRNTSESTTASQTIEIVAPTNVSVESVSPIRTRINWEYPSSFQEGFYVNRRIDDGDIERVGEVGDDARSFVDELAIDLKSEYTYSVIAFSKHNQSNSVAARFTPFFEAVAPSQLAVQVLSDTLFQITWQDNGETEEGFLLDRIQGAGSWEQIAVIEANQEEYQDFSVFQIMTSYNYRIRSFNVVDTSDYSAEAFGYMTINPPTNISAAGLSGNSLRVSWSAGNSFTLSYRIERQSIDPLSQIASGWTFAGAVNADTFSFEETVNETNDILKYRVIAITRNNETLPVESNALEYNVSSVELQTQYSGESIGGLHWVNGGIAFREQAGVANDGFALTDYVVLDSTSFNERVRYQTRSAFQYAFSQDLKYLVQGFGDYRIDRSAYSVVFDVANNVVVDTLVGPRAITAQTRNIVNSMKTSPTENLIAMGYDNFGQIVIWNMNTLTREKEFNMSSSISDEVNALEWSADGTHLLSYGFNSVYIYDVENDPALVTRIVSPNRVNSIDWSTSNNLLAYNNRDGEINTYSWDGTAATLFKQITGVASFQDIAIYPDDKSVAMVSRYISDDAWLKILDKQPIYTFQAGQVQDGASIEFSPSGQWMYLVDGNSKILLYRITKAWKSLE